MTLGEDIAQWLGELSGQIPFFVSLLFSI